LVIILPSTGSYYNQLVITHRHARHTFLNAQVLKLSKPVDHVCSGGFFPAFPGWTPVPRLTVLVWQNTLAIDKDNNPVT
jgi:hypothetical protein